RQLDFHARQRDGGNTISNLRHSANQTSPKQANPQNHNRRPDGGGGGGGGGVVNSRNHREGGCYRDGDQLTKTSTSAYDAANRFKSITICPNVLGLHEPVSFIDYIDEHPKVKYKAAPALKQDSKSVENYQGLLRETSPSQLLFTPPKDDEVGDERTPTLDTGDNVSPADIKRSSTKTTTLSLEQKTVLGEATPMIGSGDTQSWAERQACRQDSVPSEGEYEVEETKSKKSRFSVTHIGFDKVRYGRHQKRRLSFEKMKAIQVASGRGQHYGNPNFIGRQHVVLPHTTAAAPLAVHEQSSRPAPLMFRESSIESTYESQHAQQQSISGEEEDEDDDDDDEEEEVGLGGHLKRRLIEVLRRGTAKENESGHFEGLLPGNLQTLKAVAALAAVAGGMGGGGGPTDPDKTAANEEARIKLIQFDRPARELLIWSVLVGKLRMSELFWTMEKEPIAAALLASILLSALSNKTDDFTDKEDYKNYSKSFQEKAEGVLNECYREDEHRAQLIINHELAYYGHSSVIKLAAEGQSIKFMAHPCCQDFLTNTWKGNLSSKNSMFRMMFGLIFGLTMPLFIPKVLLYETEEKQNENGE
uniref:Lipase_3 domain-containing protein n=1 Tax=Mesocestoides corti TaxID=53468 RepID=A0A5K3FFH8_MESCO